jgi:hypothetical protein
MLFSGSARQSSFSGSAFRASDPGAPFGQRTIAWGCADSLAGSAGKVVWARRIIEHPKNAIATAPKKARRFHP